MPLNLLTTKNRLKIMSCFFGYALWSITTMDTRTEAWLSLPLTYTKAPYIELLSAPMTIDLHVAGTRKELRSLRNNTPLTLETSGLQQGTNTIMCSTESLGLPSGIELLNTPHVTLECTYALSQEAQKIAEHAILSLEVLA